jgi:hypothetical protein
VEFFENSDFGVGLKQTGRGEEKIFGTPISLAGPRRYAPDPVQESLGKARSTARQQIWKTSPEIGVAASHNLPRSSVGTMLQCD